MLPCCRGPSPVAGGSYAGTRVAGWTRAPPSSPIELLLSATRGCEESIHKEKPLLLRLGAKSIGDVMRAPKCADIHAPPADAVPVGVIFATANSSTLKDTRLADGLGGAKVVVSTKVDDNTPEDSPCTHPDIFDLYATISESTGSVKALYCCVGIATPVDLVQSSFSPEKSFALGMELAVIAQGARNGGERSVEWRDKGRAVDAAKEPPIVAHSLGDIKMCVRPVQVCALHPPPPLT